MQCSYIRDGLRVNHNGNMVPCCVFKGSSDFYVGQHTVEQYQSSTWLNEIEQTLEKDQWPEGCWACRASEEQKVISHRQAGTDGFTVELVIGNTCNSDCGMCGPGRSSKIAARLRQHPLPDGLLDLTDDRYLTWDGGPDRYELEKLPEIVQLLARANTVKLIGGEPLLIKEIWPVLDKLSTINPDVNLHFVTNASIYDASKFAILSKFKNLTTLLSTEGVGKHYEWLRHGLSWDAFSKNALLLDKISNQIGMNVTVGALNITGVVDIAAWGYANRIHVSFSPIVDPKILAIQGVASEIVKSQIPRLLSLQPHNKKSEILLTMLRRNLQAVAETCLSSNDPRLQSYVEYLNQHRKGSLDPKTLVFVE